MVWGLWHDVCYDELEDGEGEQDGDPQTDPLTALRRKEEGNQHQEGEEHCGYYDVRVVEQTASFQVDGEGDVRVGFAGCIVVVGDLALAGCFGDVPLTVPVEAGHINRLDTFCQFNAHLQCKNDEEMRPQYPVKTTALLH